MTVAVAVAAAVCIDVADFLPKRSSYFCVCVCLCALVYPTRRDANIIILTFYTPPAFDECSGLSLFRAVRRTRHVIIPPQYRRSDGGWNEISKTLQKPLFFSRSSFPTEKSVSTLVRELQQLNYRRRGRRLVQTPRQTHAHLARWSPDTLAPTVSYKSIVYVCVHASCRYNIINTIPSSRLRATVSVYPNDAKFSY